MHLRGMQSLYGSSSSLSGSSPKLAEQQPGSAGSAGSAAARPIAFSPSSPQLSSGELDEGSAHSVDSGSGSLQSSLEVRGCFPRGHAPAL